MKRERREREKREEREGEQEGSLYDACSTLAQVVRIASASSFLSPFSLFSSSHFSFFLFHQDQVSPKIMV